MTVHDERLYAELDRQLAEVRASCDGLASRSGLLVAAIAAVAAIVAPRISSAHHVPLLILTLVAMFIATVAGAVTLMPWLKIGPVATSLAAWIVSPSGVASRQLYDSKAVILSANLNRLLVMRVFFAIQAIFTVCAAGLALWYSAWK